MKIAVMCEEFVRSSVINAKIDPKVVTDLSRLKIGGWNNLQPSNLKLLKEFIDRSFKQRSVLCDTILGERLCEFRSTHEEIDVSS